MIRTYVLLVKNSGFISTRGLTNEEIAETFAVFSNTTPLYGDSVTLKGTIHNIGEKDATDSIIEFYDGSPLTGTLIGEKNLSISKNGTANTSVSWTAQPGIHEIHIRVNPYNSFSEKDYSNNEAASSIYVNVPLNVNVALQGNSRPDLGWTYP
jgi:subtilase family serine protease